MQKQTDFQTALTSKIVAAQSRGDSFIDVQSGELHRELGGYPGTNHRMPVCCDVMYKMMDEKDQVLISPPKGKGATLTIRYFLKSDCS